MGNSRRLHETKYNIFIIFNLTYYELRKISYLELNPKDPIIILRDIENCNNYDIV